ncbi:MAG: hypothetical protein WAZ18_06765 [Alphaproteobacteria bacterium]
MNTILKLAGIAIFGTVALLAPAQAKADSFVIAFSDGAPVRFAPAFHHGPDRRVVVHERVVMRPMHVRHWGHANRGWHKGHSRHAYHQTNNRWENNHEHPNHRPEPRHGHR